jgi:hypothetical protein
VWRESKRLLKRLEGVEVLCVSEVQLRMSLMEEILGGEDIWMRVANLGIVRQHDGADYMYVWNGGWVSAV